MRFLIILVLIFLCVFSGVSQSQLLEKRVTLNYNQARLATVLAGIKAKYGVGFSYANNHLPLDKKMSVSVTDKPLAEALNELFKESGIRYNLVAGQIVLTKGAETPKKPKPVRKMSVVEKSGSPAPGPANENPVETRKTEPDPAAVASLLPIPVLTAETEEGEEKAPEVLEKEYQSEKRNLQKNYLAQMDAAMENNDSSAVSDLKKDFKKLRQNLKEQFQSLAKKARNLKWPSSPKTDSAQGPKQSPPAQVSFVPPLSTNGTNNINCINKVSFNVLAGYSGGLNGFELGGVANLEKGNVNGAQVAGFTNLVRGDVSGTQVSGYLNVNTGRLEAAQVAGFLNVSGSDSSNAVQVSGFGNVHKGDILGAQVSGFINTNGGYVIGPQVAGFINVAGGPVSGAQVAGFMNAGSENFKGGQVAGFMNVAGKNVYGSQIAGFMNLTGKDIRGAQVSGFLNVAQKVHGSQLGIINVADTVSGIQFGLLNFSRKGYRRFEIFAMERMQANAAFKMGNRKFYNIFSAGVNPLEKDLQWSYGYGFGTERELGKRGLLDFELICNRVMEEKKIWTEELNLLNQLKINVGFKPGKRTALFAGPTVNVMVSRIQQKETGAIGSTVIPKWAQYDETNHNTRVAIWTGFNAGIRF